MEALKNKLKSRRGASIMLTLLFLLVCMMAGASILMAAASDAGKLQSNKTEQQNYLAVSSAVTMLVNELGGVEYEGQYTYKLTPIPKEIPAVDDDGNPIMGGDGNPELVDAPLYDDDGNLIPGNVDHYTRTYEQLDGNLTDGGGWLGSVLPLRDYLNYIFAENFKVPDEVFIDEYEYTSLIKKGEFGDPPIKPASSYTLTFALNDDDGDYGGLSKSVAIVVKLETDGSILLTAALEGGGTVDFTMKALLRLVPDQWPERRLVLSNSPDPALLVEAGEEDEPDTYKTDPIQWKLEYIFKEEAVPSGAPDAPP